MSTWLTAWRNRENRELRRPVIELLVVAGADAGAQFTIEGEEVLIGRGQPESGQTDTVRLDDKSISRRQAWIRADATGYSIEHIPTAANPTLVNGIEIRSARLDVGDRVDMGRISIDVRVRAGMNLSGLTEIMEVAARESTVTGAELSDIADVADLASPDAETASPLAPAAPARAPSPYQPPKDVSEEVTEMRPMNVAIGELMILRGAEDATVTRFRFSWRRFASAGAKTWRFKFRSSEFRVCMPRLRCRVVLCGCVRRVKRIRRSSMGFRYSTKSSWRMETRSSWRIRSCSESSSPSVRERLKMRLLRDLV